MNGRYAAYGRSPQCRDNRGRYRKHHCWHGFEANESGPAIRACCSCPARELLPDDVADRHTEDQP